MKTLAHFDTEFFSADVEVELEHSPKVEWKKARIPAALWQKIVGFMMWSQNKYKAEAQIRLFYNTDTDEWNAVPYPQQPNGMTTKELTDEPELYDKLRQEIKGDGWVGFGTVHHHCTASAFQSGTDHADEIDQPGFHITLGNLDKDEMSVHCRFSHNRGFAPCNLWDFVDYPVQLAHFPRLIPKWYLLSITYEFPALWTESIIEKPAWTVPSYPLGNRFQHNTWEAEPELKKASIASPTYTWYNTCEEFLEHMQDKYNLDMEEIANQCAEGSSFYHRLLSAAEEYFLEPEQALLEIYHEYSTTFVPNVQ
jgi:hypothetical protein